MFRRPVARNVLAIFAFAAAAITISLFLDTYFLGIVTTALVFVALVVAWHLVGGYLGQLSIGHSALFGVGAYAAAIVGSRYSASVPIMLLAGCLASTLVALIISPTFRTRGIYFCIATLGVTGLLQVVAVLYAPGGELGIILPFVFDPYGKASFYWALALCTATLLIAYILVQSRFGLAIRSIRDDEDAASSLGIRSTNYKVITLLISAAMTGTIAGYYSARTSFIDPHTGFDVMLNVRLILMAILGGIGTFWGPVIGAILLVASDEVLRIWAKPEIAQILYALLLLVLTLWFPLGLNGIFQRGSKTKNGT